MNFFLKTVILFAFVSGYSQKNKSVNDSLIDNAIQLRNQSKFQESMAILNTISPYSPEKNKALLEIARVHYFDKKLDESIKVLSQVDKESLSKDELHNYYLILGNVYDDNEMAEKAIELYSEAIKIFPESYLLYFNKGVTNIHLKNTEEAYKDMIKSIMIYPNFYRSHYLLGIIALENGNQSEGILAMTTGILLDFNGKITKNAVETLNFQLSKKYEDPEKRFDIEGKDLFVSTNLIINKKYALNKEYKLQTDNDMVYIRQLQALLSELPKIKERNGFFAARYIDFYTKVWESNQFNIFTYRLFQNYDSESVKKIISKKSNELKKFNEWIYTTITQTISTNEVNYFGKQQLVSVIDDDGYIGYGNMSGANKEGQWRYNYSNGIKFLEGNFKENYFDGEVNYYNDNGFKSKTLNYANKSLSGKTNNYYPNGNLFSNREFKNDKDNNKQTFYYRFGGIKSYYSMQNDKIEGKEEFFHNNGNLKSSIAYENGIVKGSSTEYFPDKTVSSFTPYENGKLSGDKKSYYADGKIYSTETYKNGKSEGDINKYYPNGDLYNTYKIENGKISYFKELLNNNVSEERFYNGDKLIRQKLYVKNIPIVEYVFQEKNGFEYVESYKPFDGKGNSLKEVKLKLNTQFNVKLGNNNIYLTGMYNSKGEKQGEWKYYDPITGLLESHTFYDKSIQTDKYEAFYSNGKLKTYSQLKDGKKDGNYISYFQNGNKSSEEFYIKDVQNGEGKNYYKNGKLKSIFFVDNDKINGTLERFDIDGSLYERSFYAEGDLIKTIFYSQGKELSTVDYFKNGLLQYSQKSNLEKTEMTINNGEIEGKYSQTNTKGEKIFNANFIDGQKYGKALFYNPNSSVSSKTNYIYNQLYGEFEKYNLDGKLQWKSSKFVNDSDYGTTEKYNQEGFKYLSSQYYNDLKNGKEIFYAKNGEELITLFYENNILISFQKPQELEQLVDKGNTKLSVNYKNGKPALNINFKNGRLDGVFNYFSEDGIPLINSMYNDSEILKREMYYATGKLYSVENFVDNDNQGPTIFYYPNGKIKIEANYMLDDLHGDYNEYDESGKVLVHKKYANDTIIEY